MSTTVSVDTLCGHHHHPPPFSPILWRVFIKPRLILLHAPPAAIPTNHWVLAGLSRVPPPHPPDLSARHTRHPASAHRLPHASHRPPSHASHLPLASQLTHAPPILASPRFASLKPRLASLTPAIRIATPPSRLLTSPHPSPHLASRPSTPRASPATPPLGYPPGYQAGLHHP